MAGSPSISASDLQQLSQRLDELQSQLIGFGSAIEKRDLPQADATLERLNGEIAALRSQWRELIAP